MLWQNSDNVEAIHSPNAALVVGHKTMFQYIDPYTVTIS